MSKDVGAPWEPKHGVRLAMCVLGLLSVLPPRSDAFQVVKLSRNVIDRYGNPFDAAGINEKRAYHRYCLSSYRHLITAAREHRCKSCPTYDLNMHTV
jgi:hypothetical protein